MRQPAAPTTDTLSLPMTEITAFVVSTWVFLEVFLKQTQIIFNSKEMQDSKCFLMY